MKAIYNGGLWTVIGDDGNGLILDPIEGDTDQRFYVSYDNYSLLLDPTDEQIERLRKPKEAQ